MLIAERLVVFKNSILLNILQLNTSIYIDVSSLYIMLIYMWTVLQSGPHSPWEAQ